MAADLQRTVADEVRDAFARLAEAEREIINLRAHLTRALDNPDAGVLHQARRSARIVSGCIDEAEARTTEAYRRSLVPSLARSTTSLRSVS